MRWSHGVLPRTRIPQSDPGTSTRRTRICLTSRSGTYRVGPSSSRARRCRRAGSSDCQICQRRPRRYHRSTGAPIRPGKRKAFPRDGRTSRTTRRASARNCATRIGTATFPPSLYARSGSSPSSTTRAPRRIRPQHRRRLHPVHHHQRTRSPDTSAVHSSTHDR